MSSTGVDYIDVGTIKLVKYELAEALQTIINLTIQTSPFPELYKQSKIIPLKKKPGLNNLECSSYRPVNLLPIPGKVVEKAIINQLLQ